ncbi:MAG: isocitrate dehydrogenase kinase/phosphatase AceK regulatory subunit, partial [Rhodoferax sp.]|uniref:isocitrate dehydrogenase kinase/phosphatase AceK regulatory subunit n=1 Tax=Rhodoferax sp. TaxID=50421 RepID=UPI0032633490
MFPQRLDSLLAYDIAKAMVDGFNRHYRLFRSESARAKHRFETADWHGQQRAQRERIEFYDLRVRECSTRLEREFKAGDQGMDVWQQVKLHYIGLLVEHRQPELAETFFNSVTTKMLHRSYFQNDFIFVRPAVSTEYLEAAEPRPTYRAYYPTRATLGAVLLQMVQDFDLQRAFGDLERDIGHVEAAVRQQLGEVMLRANFQIQVLSGLFFRNKGAYICGKVINGFQEHPFALPILHVQLHYAESKLVIDAALFGEDDMLLLFSFARA